MYRLKNPVNPCETQVPAAIGRRALLRRAILWGSATLWGGGMGARAIAAETPRIITVGGALTEIIYALGAESSLVGVDTTSLFPAAAQKLPNVGYARSLSIEGILALLPTQLIATEDAGPPVVLRQLEQARVALSILPAHYRFEGVLQRVARMGELLQKSARANQICADLTDQWQRLTRQIEEQRQANALGVNPLGEACGPRVLFVLSHQPGQMMAGGAGTGADAMIRYAGGCNAVTAFSGYKPLTPESVIAARPDLILFTAQGFDAIGGIPGVLQIPGVDQTVAGRMRRVIAFETMFLLGFGPRMPAAVAALNGAFLKAMPI